jgi:hypothetical protein
MKRVGVLVTSVLVLAACGGGGGGGGGNSDAAKVKQVWTSFFSSKTPVSQKPALVQNGSKFTAAINALANNPLAQNTSAKVSSVTLQGTDKATVKYKIYLGSTPAPIPAQTGLALKENGSWVIADASLCSLLKLEGSAPPACKT